MTATVKPVHEAWLDVMSAVQSIGKGDRNEQQGFSFRGIDATLNAVGPALRDARVFVRPSRIVERVEERYATRSGTQMRNVTLTIEWAITGPAGDSFTAQTVGEAADSGDKAVSKAHSVAYRTLLLQALTVPTGDRDPDADAHERVAPTAPDERERGWRSISAKGRQLGLTDDAIRQQYQALMGHEIDGPESSVESLREFYNGMKAVINVPEAAPEPSADPWTTPAGDAA